MKKPSFKILALLIISMLSFRVGAEPVDIDQAATVAATQVELMENRHQLVESPQLNSQGAVPSAVTVINAQGNALAYVFNLDPAGFVVVTSNTDLTPVISYSNQGSFTMDGSNVLLDILRKDLANRMSAVRWMDEGRIDANHRQWERMLSGTTCDMDPGESWPPVGRTFSGGWIETAWTQNSPYNDKCPIDPVTEDRCVAGCPAIAMAQIINFWQYPDSVIFTESDSYTSIYQGRVIEIDAPAASIPLIDYNYGDPSDETAASICYACGVATESVFSSIGSGVFTNSWCAHGFTEHFDYTSADFREGDGGDFYEVMKQNIKDSMPAIIVIVGDIGGHTLVCDGFREPDAEGDNQWHLNFGWGASQPDPLSQAWYVIPQGIPMGLNTLIEAIVNIEAPRRPEPAAVEERIDHDEETFSCTLFAGSSTISYTLSACTRVNLSIYDASGRLVRILVNEAQNQGNHSAVWYGTDALGNHLSSGCYFVKLQTRYSTSTQRMVLIK